MNIDKSSTPVPNAIGGANDDRSLANQPLAQIEQQADGAVVAVAGGEGDPVDRFSEVVSGQFDEELAVDESTPFKRVLLPQPDAPKLHKVLAQSGMGSRLEMEQLILEGRITVNNEPAHIGQRIQFGDHIKVNGRPIRYRIDPPAARVIAYHKPAGEVVTHDDPQNRPTVFRRLPKLHHELWGIGQQLDAPAFWT
jgi:23S rRNA pseudouridine2605 synthase